MVFKGPVSVITNGSMTGSLTSAVTIMDQLVMLSYAIIWSGTNPVGSISVEVSNDYSVNANGAVRNAGTWKALPLSTTSNVSGNSDSGFIDIDANAGYALRLVYTRVSGVGTMQVIAMGK